jgi:hypothetical protein
MKNGEGGRRKNNNNDAFNFGSIFSSLFYLFSAYMQICVCIAFSVFIYFQHVCVSSVYIKST